MPNARIALAATLACCACQTPPPASRPDRAVVLDHALGVQVENDSIGFGDSTDKAYTNGIELEWTPPMRDLDGGFARFVRSLPLLPADADGPQLAVFFGQQMFTPEDIETPTLIVGDRPYAGWLYGGVAARNVQLGSPERREDRLDEWRLDLGIVGPSSAADTVQIEWHEILDTRTPRGWANQLRDEPGVILAYRRALRHGYQEFSRHAGGDSLLEFRGRLGNVHTDLALGAAIRAGFNLPRDFGTAARLARRAADGRELRPATTPWSLYAVAGVHGSAVVYNIFLDGNTLRTSHQVDRNRFVADFYAGVELRCSRYLRVSYRHVLRTAEFDSSLSIHDMQDFAVLEFLVTM